MIVLIDNYDSFVYNLVQAIRTLGRTTRVLRNDRVSIPELEALSPTHLVVSPGPRSPAESGISVEAVRGFAGRVPVLGVCLGHQCIGAAWGARVVRGHRPVHGKTSAVRHGGGALYEGVPARFEAARYHSLVVDPEGLPAELVPTAWSDDGALMGLRHKELTVEGVQFHPESFLTPEGPRMIRNFLGIEGGRWDCT